MFSNHLGEMGYKPHLRVDFEAVTNFDEKNPDIQEIHIKVTGDT